MKLEQVPLVLLLQEHDAVLQQDHVKVDGLDASAIWERQLVYKKTIAKWPFFRTWCPPVSS